MVNFVLFHLESLNCETLFRNKRLFPNINSYLKTSTLYTNYFSSATSTFMAISDILWGDTDVYESATELEDIFDIIPSKPSLLDTLNGQYGYNTYDVSMLHESSSDYENMEKFHCQINRNGFFKRFDDEKSLSELIEEASHEVKPFTIFIYDDVSHISYFGSRRSDNGLDKVFAERYSSLDRTFGTVVETLRKCGKLEDTIIIAYGDHGEEYWFHDLYQGYTHAIEPYDTLVNCPLIIGNGKQYIENENLISSVDIQKIVLGLINNENIDGDRKYAFSRNLYAMQNVNAKLFHKAYSVSNGEYRLIASTRGIALYNRNIDPYNQNNLLRFFKIKDGKIKYDVRFDVLRSSHIKSFFDEETKDNICSVFIELSGELNKKLSVYSIPLHEIKWNRIYKKSNMIGLTIIYTYRFLRSITVRQIKKIFRMNR